MKISVTQSHINRGKKDHCYFCPIALAIAESASFGAEVAVFGFYTRIDGIPYCLPKEVEDFVSNYDHEIPVTPFEFEFGYTA